MSKLKDNSVDLIITSPPYPMVKMWDDVFCEASSLIKEYLFAENGAASYKLMHKVLENIWSECIRVLKPGSFFCINIGDAARKVGDGFCLYPNHATITESLSNKNLIVLPMIHWFKPTNAPNKFMGSGMLPAGAYVKMEHEYILVFKKPGKRSFTEEEKTIRRRSAFFWEERNLWFSDVWSIKGKKQKIKDQTAARERSAAFPEELVNRLINMFSVQGDTVLDPFIGTGTTLKTCIQNGRACIGFEIDESMRPLISKSTNNLFENSKLYNDKRLKAHESFIKTRENVKYINENYGFPVVTRQERYIIFPELSELNSESQNENDSFFAEYKF
ncbi:MAG: site-specific DNA-methyltransferase [Spirochaetales bacterium]|nr:site-specific DNA-methyltransferase [Spirochaetales bacterium]